MDTWSDWQTLSTEGAFSSHTLAETLDGGQAFRWERLAESDAWQGVWGRHIVRLRLQADGRLRWSASRDGAADVRPALDRYLGQERDWVALAEALPWRTDAHLAACRAAFPRLRLLRQPLGETLLGFLCSATKQIVQIKQMVALLAQRHGPIIAEGIHALPSWETLAQLSEESLRACLLGFRARYIRETALFLAAHPGWLEAIEHLPYREAKQQLCSLPGVGEKVADCVLLFGAGQLEAFPVDVWILKAMAGRYGLQGWRPAQIAHFGRIHFGPLAGLAQQYLFAYERHVARNGRSSAG